MFLKVIFSPELTENSLGTKAKTSKAMAFLASNNALAAVATTATPTSFNEALRESLGAGAEAVTLEEVALAYLDFRPVNDGMETSDEVILAICKELEE